MYKMGAEPISQQSTQPVPHTESSSSSRAKRGDSWWAAIAALYEVMIKNDNAVSYKQALMELRTTLNDEALEALNNGLESQLVKGVATASTSIAGATANAYGVAKHAEGMQKLKAFENGPEAKALKEAQDDYVLAKAAPQQGQAQVMGGAGAQNAAAPADRINPAPSNVTEAEIARDNAQRKYNEGRDAIKEEMGTIREKVAGWHELSKAAGELYGSFAENGIMAARQTGEMVQGNANQARSDEAEWTRQMDDQRSQLANGARDFKRA
jgi:hypothetical protein